MLTVYLIVQVLMVDHTYAGTVPIPIAYYDTASCEQGKRDWIDEYGGGEEDGVEVSYVCTEYLPQIN